jgi:hypothetical protein
MPRLCTITCSHCGYKHDSISDHGWAIYRAGMDLSINEMDSSGRWNLDEDTAEEKLHYLRHPGEWMDLEECGYTDFETPAWEGRLVCCYDGVCQKCYKVKRFHDLTFGIHLWNTSFCFGALFIHIVAPVVIFMTSRSWTFCILSVFLILGIFKVLDVLVSASLRRKYSEREKDIFVPMVCDHCLGSRFLSLDKAIAMTGRRGWYCPECSRPTMKVELWGIS